jgi:LacI family transcriptional regulator
VIVDCTDTFGRAILRGVTRYANLQRRWHLYKDIANAFQAYKEWGNLDGGIFAGVPADSIPDQRTRCTHIVYCSGSGDPRSSPVVALDDRAAGAQAAEHLIDCGLENFAFYGFRQDFRTAINRFEGFRQTIQDRGFNCALAPMTIPTKEQRAAHAQMPRLVEWLKSLPKPIGILAVDDTNASDLAEACLEADIGVPDAIAIVGINNDDLLCESSWPPLSSVDADFSRVGYVAASTLDRLMRGEKLKMQDRLILLPPLGVVKRHSTSTLAIKDSNIAEALRYIREHACDPCGVSDVLQHVPVNRRWLERQFVAQLGRTPHDEIARVRIETAQRLLQRSEMDMFEISSRCGFAELKGFYSAFRKLTGTTPAAYRRSALIGAK